ncbi:MAG TPA: O-antigen ligase family protein [Burkholderiales bacterium]|nr:O-antigen ligase family protein [Burkholderiales bacterium]
MLWLLGLGGALLIGMVTAIIGSEAGYRSVYYVAVLALVGLAAMLAATRKQPLRFAFLALIACFPLASAEVPPGRLGLTVFDVGMILLGLGLVVKKLLNPEAGKDPFFPSPSLLAAWLLLLPCVLFSRYPAHSLISFLAIFGGYAFFLLVLDELKRERGFERLVMLMALVSIVIAAGLFIDSSLHVNLSMRGGNLNQVTYVGGVPVWRAGGFFQDPQRAGAFLGCLVAFFFMLSVRGRFRGQPLSLLVWLAIIMGAAALMTTISRSAILACIAVCAFTFFIFNGWNLVTKLVVAVALGVLAFMAAMTPWENWLNILPSAVIQRVLESRTEIMDRVNIWVDTWDMFANHPLFGIGPGSFQPYLMETRPTVTNFYGIGAAEGVSYVPDQPESGYLKILYEGGIVGAVAALLVAGDTLRRAALIIARGGVDDAARTESIAAFAGLLTFAVTFVTLFNLSDGRIAGMFFMFLAVIWRHSLVRAAATRTVKVRSRFRNDDPFRRIGAA